MWHTFATHIGNVLVVPLRHLVLVVLVILSHLLHLENLDHQALLILPVVPALLVALLDLGLLLDL